MKLVVLNVVGLRMADLDAAPRLRELADRGFGAPQRTVLPAVTCSVQATWLTGGLPRDHGIVGNGWYFHDLAQVWLWRQSNHLVQGEKLYETARRRDSAFTCAKLFWWWNMYAAVDWSVTPRPEYHADGLKKPGIYTHPAGLGPRLQERHGGFPLFQFWGPGAGIACSTWITDAALTVMAEHDPTLTLVYLPHLDYDHQRYGPNDPRSRAAVGEIDREAGRLIDAAHERGAEVVVVSEYGIEKATAPVFINRALHRAGSVGRAGDQSRAAARRRREPGVRRGRPPDRARLRAEARATSSRCGRCYKSSMASRAVLDEAGQRDCGLDHERSGQLVCLAEPGCWFAYHYWLDEDRRPDFAPTVDIHRKPGYDPTELFLDPKIRFPKLKVARVLAKKLLGFRYLMDVIGTDPTLVRGTHGRLYEDPQAGPVYLSSSAEDGADEVCATDVKERWLRILAKGR